MNQRPFKPILKTGEGLATGRTVEVDRFLVAGMARTVPVSYSRHQKPVLVAIRER